MSILSALLLGTAAGLRSMAAPAAVVWAARLGILGLTGTVLGFLARGWVVALLTVMAVGELVADKLPFVPNRTDLGPLLGRLVTGGVAGLAVGLSHGLAAASLLAGCIGALAGAFGGFRLRARMARAFGRDLPAALVEDAVALVLVAVALSML